MNDSASDPIIRALYSPERREVACVIIQAMYGGDRRACEAVQDWRTDSPVGADYRMISAPLSQWRKIGMMPRDQRPGPEDFRR